MGSWGETLRKPYVRKHIPCLRVYENPFGASMGSRELPRKRLCGNTDIACVFIYRMNFPWKFVIMATTLAFMCLELSAHISIGGGDMSEIEIFQNEYPSTESYWRAIVLFGKNVASYKFALASTLLELAPKGKTVLTLDELSEPFSRYLCEHLVTSPKQGTSQSSQFLDACKQFNDGKIPKDELLHVTAKKGFNNVIDAFHVVNNAPVPTPFFHKDYDGRSKRIILTDELLRLQELPFYCDFDNEVNARWNLVETAWELGVSRNLLHIQYDDLDSELFVEDALRRKSVTSAKDALNGYQKGKCFYCFDDITINENNDLVCDVDHFFPHALKATMRGVNLDGVWNLVLACPRCNRGGGGKFALAPATKYLVRLHKRNEFLISSHHPLRETLMNQTGVNEQSRASYLRNTDRIAVNTLIHRWETTQVGQEVF